MMKDQELGEILMIGFDGVRVNNLLRRYILRWKVGGVILFGRNILDPDQVAELCGDLKRLRREVADTLLLIAIDQEGGTVVRLREGVTAFPGNLALGFAGSSADACYQGRIVGRELREHGINMNLAPVLDLYSDLGSKSLGLRSLGGDPEKASEMGAALIKGMQDEGVIATAKHFPGKGLARVDSHEALPVIKESIEELKRRDIIPFQRAIAAGVKAIMTSHAAYPAFEDRVILPGTASRNLMTGFLRDELHFRGILISDDLGMGALRGGYSAKTTAIESLKAGVDILLLCHDPVAREEVLSALSVGRKKDREIGERIEESMVRIAAVKSWLNRPEADRAPALNPDGNELSLRIARKGISIHRSSGGEIPIDPESRLFLVRFQPEITVEVEGSAMIADDPERYLKALGFNPEVINIPLQPGAEEGGDLLNRLPGRVPVIVACYDAYRYPGQKKLIDGVLERRPDAILAVTRDPRDADLFPRSGTIIITRGYSAPSLQALAELLAGNLILPEKK